MAAGRPWFGVFRISLAVAALAAILVALMIWSVDDILFPTHAVPAPGPMPPGAERVSLATPGGEVLHGIHVPAEQGSKPRILILGFGGNAWNGEDVGSFLHELFPNAEVVAFHYRGYRPSTGRPSADAMIEDAPLVLDFALDRVKPDRAIAIGFSIGTGVAANLAKDDRVHGLVLVTPFDSLKAVAADAWPFLPIGMLLRNELDVAQMLAGTDVPVAMIAAERDELIPSRRTSALREVVPNLVFDRTIERAGHNDIYGRSEFRVAMDEALKAVTP